MEKIYKILEDLSGVSDIHPESELVNDLSLDSLSMVTLLLALEDAFNFSFDESDMNPFDLTTVQDIICVVEKYVGDIHE